MPNRADIPKQIAILARLQEIDAEIYQLKREKEKHPKELARLKEEFKNKSTGVKQAEEKFTALQLKKKEKEGLLGTKEEGIKKLQGQLFQIKTNKEYSAMQKEIESQKADKSLAEDEILFLMEEIDTAKVEISREKQILIDEEKKLKEQEAQVNARLLEIEKRLQELNTHREAIVQEADKNILKKYERILVGKDGLAIVPIESDACSGCHMNLPPQVINEVRLKDKFIVCETCARILYIKE